MLYFNTNVGATLVWVNPIDPLAMKTANPRAEPLPEHGEGREVQLGVAMGVSVMLLRIDLGLVVEEPIQNVGFCLWVSKTFIVRPVWSCRCRRYGLCPRQAARCTARV